MQKRPSIDTLVMKITNPTSLDQEYCLFGGNIPPATSSGTSSVDQTINTGDFPIFGAVDPTTGRVYISNGNDNTVSIYDSNNTLITTVVTGTSPTGVAYSPATGKIYVANQSSANITVITGLTVTSTIALPGGTNPQFLEYNPRNTSLYVTGGVSHNIVVIDSSDTITANITDVTYPILSGAELIGATYSPANERMYITDRSQGYIHIFNLNVLESTITIGTAPGRGTYSSVTENVYIVDSANDNVIQVTKANVTSTFSSDGDNPQDISFNAVSGLLYVTNFNDNELVTFNSSNQVVQTITVGNSPGGVFYNSANAYTYVLNTADDTASLIATTADLSTNNVQINTSSLTQVNQESARNPWVIGAIKCVPTDVDQLFEPLKVRGKSPYGHIVDALWHPSQFYEPGNFSPSNAVDLYFGKDPILIDGDTQIKGTLLAGTDLVLCMTIVDTSQLYKIAQLEKQIQRRG